jgi:hypothetical protein
MSATPSRHRGCTPMTLLLASHCPEIRCTAAPASPAQPFRRAHLRQSSQGEPPRVQPPLRRSSIPSMSTVAGANLTRGMARRGREASGRRMWCWRRGQRWKEQRKKERKNMTHWQVDYSSVLGTVSWKSKKHCRYSNLLSPLLITILTTQFFFFWTDYSNFEYAVGGAQEQL